MNSLHHIIRKAILGSLLVFATLGIGIGIYAMTLLPELPTITEIRQVPLNIPLRIYNNDNQLIAEYGNERRITVSIDNIPPLLIEAVVATEDDRFYNHFGVDFISIARAIWSNFRSKSRSQGASTITMQVARNFFLTPEKTYIRKFKEILLAFNMERALTKDQILELYLNKIFLGHRAYGFAAAAQVYYGVELQNLSVPEITMLAGLPKAPSHDNPISNPARAIERRSYVLKRLHELGKIDDLSYQSALKAPVTATRNLAESTAQAPYVAEMVRQWMVNRFGKRVYELGYRVTLTINGAHQAQAEAALRNGLLKYTRRHGFRGPIATLDLTAHTPDSLDQTLQRYPKSRNLVPAAILTTAQYSFTARTQAQQTIRVNWPQIEWAKRYLTPNETEPEPTSVADVVGLGDVVYVSPVNSTTWRLDQMPQVSGALVSLDPNSGAIRALSGGFDYYLSKFNRATQALRQPGSNIKPFIYSAALENGFTPSSLVNAVPIVIVDDLEGVWRPQNYSKRFFGPTRLRKALSISLNLVSVRLLRTIGIDTTINHLAKFGFDADKLPRNLTLALGSTDVTPLNLAASFAIFANQGKRVTPYLIERIVDGNGNKVIVSDNECDNCLTQSTSRINIVKTERATEPTASEENRAISAQNAFLINSMMQQVILTGTGRRALSLQRNDLSGKTGTTNSYQDAWFSGFTPDVVTTVFIGFDKPSHLGQLESGATSALPIWVDYMGGVLKDFPERPLTPPDNITTGFINKTTGKLTSLNDTNGYWEYYLPGTEPTNRVTSESATQPPSDFQQPPLGELF